MWKWKGIVNYKDVYDVKIDEFIERKDNDSVNVLKKICVEIRKLRYEHKQDGVKYLRLWIRDFDNITKFE